MNNKSPTTTSSYKAGVCHHFGFPNPTLCNECIEIIQARAEEDEEDDFKHKRRRVPSWIQPVYSKWEAFDGTNVILVILLALAVVVLVIPTYYHSAVAYRKSHKHTASKSETLSNGHSKRTIERISEDAGGGKALDAAEEGKMECHMRETTFTTTVTITSLRNHTVASTETKTITEHVTATTAGPPITVTVFTDPPRLKNAVITDASIHLLGLGGPQSFELPYSTTTSDYNLSIDKTKTSKTKVTTSTSSTKILADGGFRRPS